MRRRIAIALRLARIEFDPVTEGILFGALMVVILFAPIGGH